MTTPSSSPSAASSDIWTTRRLLDWMGRYLAAKGVDDSRLTSELLLASVIGCQRLRLFMEVDRPASKDELAQLRAMVKRIGNHEPVQYVLGEGWFYGRPFEVNRSTLIPRSCTETLVEHVIWHVRREGVVPPDGTPVPRSELRILDIGTGTGCIGITLAAEIPAARIFATDITEEILSLAQRNATRYGVAERIEFRQGALMGTVNAGDCFDIICSNPPYIPDAEWGEVPRNVKEHEPATALRGGRDGIEFIQPLIAQSAHYLHPGGLLAVEIASIQKDSVVRLAHEAGFTSVEVIKDHEQKWRVLLARNPPARARIG